MQNSQRIQQNLILFSVFIIIILLGGTVGYSYIEGWTIFDSFYMTVITLTTVGYGEVRPLSTLGRWFTVGLMISGVSGVAYGFSLISQYLFDLSLTRFDLQKRMTRNIEKLEDHYILCGYGRVGQNATGLLLHEGHAVVVVDNSEESLEALRYDGPDGLYFMIGDATHDEILLQAGLNRAKGLLICTGDDANNLFVALSARALNPDLLIVARTSHPHNEAKMIRAGANKVISPYRIGGQRMANFAIRPDLAEMLDVVTTNTGLELWLEDLVVHPESSVVDKTLYEADIRRKTGVTIIVLSRAGQDVMTPGADTQLAANDHLVVIGTRDQVEKLAELVTEQA